LDPVYIWNNNGGEVVQTGYVATQTYYPDNCGYGQNIGTYLQEGRDYYVNVGSPTWAPYIYPHPLHALFGNGRLAGESLRQRVIINAVGGRWVSHL